MNFSKYIKSRVIPLLILLAAIGLVGLMLWALSYSAQIIAVVAGIFFFALIAATVWDYLSRRRFYNDLQDAIDSDNDAFYMTEFIRDPSFYEGRLSFDAIEKATKDMNDKIASYHRASDEYREYIETWIHEVKTPIAASRLTLSNNQDDPIARPIERDIDRIESCVEQALFYSRSSAVEKDYLIRQVDLDDLIKAVVKKNSRAFIENGINPRFESLDLKVYSDAKWLEFIVSQIVANAIKYHRPKNTEHEPQIIFSAKTSDGNFESEYVILSITDNGIGIPQSDLGRVFEKGFTGENGRRYARSTGIGLYLCKILCEKMKLKISISSVEGEYTMVSIEFPLSKMFFLK